MAAILYGVGVGPGDYELMTLKAVRVINESSVIAVPEKNPYNSIAYKIAEKVVDMKDKKVIGIEMPMTKDANLLENAHQEAAKIIAEYLEEDMQVAFLNLGDVSIYSTYMYIHKKITDMGYKAAMISGIPSFCAAAARIGESLAQKNELLHIIPASYDISKESELNGTKVLMKSGRQIKKVKEILTKKNADVVMIQNCGMDNEKISYGAENIDENAGYYSLLIVKEKDEE